VRTFKTTLQFACALTMITAFARAESVTVVRHFDGYACMSLDPASEAATSQSKLPPLFAEPSASSQQVGFPTGIVLVRTPRHEVNGFVEMLRMNGQKGWINAQNLRVWHSPNGSAAKCQPAVLSNGRIGTDIN
jgi:hypothetical protein